ncbi:hypothetical protein YPPY11_4440, partial [Yersinia pestis PY-11]
MSSQHR